MVLILAQIFTLNVESLQQFWHFKTTPIETCHLALSHSWQVHQSLIITCDFELSPRDLDFHRCALPFPESLRSNLKYKLEFKQLT